MAHTGPGLVGRPVTNSIVLDSPTAAGSFGLSRAKTEKVQEHVWLSGLAHGNYEVRPPSAYAPVLEGPLAARQRRENCAPVKPTNYIQHKLVELSESSSSKALQFLKDSHMNYANRYAMGSSVRVSDAGMEVREVREQAARESSRRELSLSEMVRASHDEKGEKPTDLWRSPLDNVQTKIQPTTQMDAGQMRLQNLMRPYTTYRLERNPRLTTAGYFYAEGRPADVQASFESDAAKLQARQNALLEELSISRTSTGRDWATNFV